MIKNDLRAAIQEVRREDLLNAEKRQTLVNQMAVALQYYLLKKGRVNTHKLKQILLINGNAVLFNIEEEFFLKNPTFIRKFNEIADQYDYFYKGDIQTILMELSKESTTANDIKRWERLRLIQSIESYEGTFKIDTDFGEIVFEELRNIFYDEMISMEEHAKNYSPIIYKNCGLKYFCHLTAIDFIKKHPEYEIVVSMCPHVFESTWWLHSYLLAPDGKTIYDFANNFKMDIETFQLLFMPHEIVRAKKDDFERLQAELNYISPNEKLDEAKALKNMAILGRAHQLLKK